MSMDTLPSTSWPLFSRTNSSRNCSEHPFAIKGVFHHSISRYVGLSAHLGWARLLIDRTNEQIIYPDAKFNNSTLGDNGDDEANEHEIYFNPRPRLCCF